MRHLKQRLKMTGICAVVLSTCLSCGIVDDTKGSESNMLMQVSSGTIGEALMQSVLSTIGEDVDREKIFWADTIPDGNEMQDEMQGMFLLVVIDNSGSMEPSGKVIWEAMDVIQKLIAAEKDAFLDVDYVTFCAEKTEFLSEDEVKKIVFGGETSVYKGIFEIDKWIKQQTEKWEKAGNHMGIIVFSDMFSSRTKDNSVYSDKTAANTEQNCMNSMAEEWVTLIENGVLDICLIQWESMAEGEDSSMTVDNKEMTDFTKGFQVRLDPLKEYVLDLDDVRTDKNKLGAQAQAEILRNCLKGSLQIITGADELEWVKKEITPTRQSTRFFVEDSFRLYICIDADAEDVKAYKLTETTENEEYSVKCLHSGEVTDIYMIENVEEGDIVIQAKSDSTNADLEMYYLFVPSIKVSAKITGAEKKLEVGKSFYISVNRSDGQEGIRYVDINTPLEVKVEIESNGSGTREEVFSELFTVSEGEEIQVTPKKKGKYIVVVKYVNQQGKEKEIERTTLIVQ